MPVCYFIRAIILLSMVGLSILTGCHSRSSVPAPLFGDEKSMRQSLKGTWILKEYEDSIDAGLTPKLLEYMLVHTSIITISSGPGTGNYILYFDNDTSETYAVLFDRLYSRVIAGNKGSGKNSKVDTLTCSISDGDTLLSINKDSMVLTFAKYDISKCAEVEAYGHLVNSKFIAGIYYVLGDTARRHHIIFTKCGDIEGARFIAPEFHDISNYSISLAGFYTDPDQMTIYNIHNDNWKSDADNIHWEVVNDSLLLWHDRFGKTDPIVLVKAI